MTPYQPPRQTRQTTKKQHEMEAICSPHRFSFIFNPSQKETTIRGKQLQWYLVSYTYMRIQHSVKIMWSIYYFSYSYSYACSSNHWYHPAHLNAATFHQISSTHNNLFKTTKAEKSSSRQKAKHRRNIYNNKHFRSTSHLVHLSPYIIW